MLLDLSHPEKYNIYPKTWCKVWFGFLVMIYHYQATNLICILQLDSNGVFQSHIPTNKVKNSVEMKNGYGSIYVNLGYTLIT